MKTIYDIAKTELQTLFYSPVAWLILIIFAFQSSMTFMDTMGGMVRNQFMGNGNNNGTLELFSGSTGLFSAVQGYLYLYIPLLTMNLMSRELGSGSIKLLYSSPVTNLQIILGKYFSMMLYGLVLVGILMIYVIYTAFALQDADIPLMLSGLLGVYFLICAYAAIGLFMSSLTSYQVVAAIGTLAILAALTYVKDMWQDIIFVRDLTFWFAISGRAVEFVDGLICSEDVIYFLVVIILFLSMTVIRLQARRQKSSWIISWSKYLGIWFLALFFGYLSSRPIFMSFADVTRTKQNTLTQNSQDIVKRLDGGLTITTYVNLLDRNYWVALPSRVNWDMQMFEQYQRFKPEIKMEYVYYYDQADTTYLAKYYPGLDEKEIVRKIIEMNGLDSSIILTPEQIHRKIDLSEEKNRFVRVLRRENGEYTFLRVFNDNRIFPGEAEISAAFKRLVMKLPKVGFLTGHGERNTTREGDRDYSMFTQDKPFRHSLINQGFDFENITLNQNVPTDISILVIAEMRQPLTKSENRYLNEYVAQGGNLVIVGEPNRQDIMNPLVESLGVSFMPGFLVRPTENFSADLIVAKPTREAAEMSYVFKQMRHYQYVVTMPGVTGLEYTTDKGFHVIPLFETDSVHCWNELETINFVDDIAQLNPTIGEEEKTYATALALSRKIGEKEQKIIIFGDADCISNGEFTRGRKDIRSSNYSIIQGVFFWLSNGEVPIDVRRPSPLDNKVYVNEQGMNISKIILIGGMPCLLFLMIIFIWLRRRGR